MLLSFLQTYLYNDLFFYNIKKNNWVKSEIPNPPPPRCSHQVRLTPGGLLCPSLLVFHFPLLYSFIIQLPESAVFSFMFFHNNKLAYMRKDFVILYFSHKGADCTDQEKVKLISKVMAVGAFCKRTD